MSCGRQPRPGRTPKDTVRSLEAALHDGDLGAAYDLLSARAQREVEGSLRGVRAQMASVPEAQLRAAGLGGMRKLDAREFLDRSGSRLPKNAASRLRQLAIVVMDLKQYDDRATAKVALVMKGNSYERRIPLVKVKRRWRLDSASALFGLPVRITPDVPALCAGPS